MLNLEQKITKSTPKNQNGYSLVELTIVLVVIGIIGFFSIRFISQIGSQALNQQLKSDLEIANHAISGFILSNSRLPCPDTNGDGLENCIPATNVQGSLPINTLGIESTIQKSRGGLIRYGVFRRENATVTNDVDLAALKDRYVPLLPNSETSVQSNGLDFCIALKNASVGPREDITQINIGTVGINVAYVIADSGTIDANGDGILFDGTNGAGIKFEKPNASHLNNYDDNVVAVGFDQLAGRLNCARALSETNGAARASFASYDMWLVAEQYKLYRDFHVHYLEVMLEIAETKFALAIAAEALAIGSAALAIGVAIITAGASAIVSAVLAVVALADATFALAQAIITRQAAIDSLAAGIIQQTEATTALTNAAAFRDAKLAEVRLLDQRGLVR